MTHQAKGFGLKIDANFDGHIPHQVLVCVEKAVCKRALNLKNLASINKPLFGDQGRDFCNRRPTGCFNDIKLPRCILVLQRTCQIRFGAILGVTKQTFHIRFVGVGIVLLFNHGVFEFDGHLLDLGLKEIIDDNHFLVCDTPSIAFGDLELEFHVALGQGGVVWGRFNVEFNGTATFDSRLGVIRLPSST